MSRSIWDGRITISLIRIITFLSLPAQAYNPRILNRLAIGKRVQIVNALVEGNSLGATARMCDVAFNTGLKLLPEIGAACETYQRRALVNLPCRRLQCDEIWSFCYAKEKNVPEELQGERGFGDVWTWVAIDADTKLIPCWRVGARDAWTAQNFMYDVASRLANRVQLTTDGLRVYLEAVELALGGDRLSDVGQAYSSDRSAGEVRYSPAECIGCREIPITGRPKRRHISTSYAERQNLTMRMNMRRFTRLTNAFSKKYANHCAATALYFMHYNFCRIHQTLRVTPAMEAGISDHVWSIEEVVCLLDNAEKKRVA